MTDPKPLPEKVLELIEPLLAADIIAPVELPDLPEGVWAFQFLPPKDEQND